MSLFVSDSRQMTQFIQFSSRLHALLGTHLGLKDALDILHDDESDRHFKEKISQMKTTLFQGSSFQMALVSLTPSTQKIPLQLDQTIPNIRQFLAEISSNAKSEWDSLQKLKKELAYPLFLLASCIALVFLFLLVLLPNYVSFFNKEHTPWILECLIGVSGFIRQFGLAFLFLGILTFILGGPKLKKPFLHAVQSQLSLPQSVPLFWTFGLLLQSGYSFKESLDSIQLESSHPCYNAFQETKKMIQHSGKVALSFDSNFKLSRYQIERLKNGEQTNTLAEAFMEISADLKRIYTEKRAKKLTLVQPLLLVMISGMILGFLYLSFLPIIQGMKAL